MNPLPRRPGGGGAWLCGRQVRVALPPSGAPDFARQRAGLRLYQTGRGGARSAAGQARSRQVCRWGRPPRNRYFLFIYRPSVLIYLRERVDRDERGHRDGSLCLTFTGYCHYQCCMVYGKQKGGWGGVAHCTMAVHYYCNSVGNTVGGGTLHE